MKRHHKNIIASINRKREINEEKCLTKVKGQEVLAARPINAGHMMRDSDDV